MRLLAGFATLLALAACGGGAGQSSMVDNRVVSAAVASLKFLPYQNGTNQLGHVSFIYAKDLDADGIDEILFVGFAPQPNSPSRYSNTNIQILGWRNGQFANLTAQWLPNNDHQVQGVGDVCFGDFNGDGKIDVFLSAYTDMNHAVHPYALMNNGTHFTKVTFDPKTWMHGVVCKDVNNDGYDDVLVAGYSNLHYYLGSTNGLNAVQSTSMIAGSGIAVGDFLNTGSQQAVIVDTGIGFYNTNFDTGQDTKLYLLSTPADKSRVDFEFFAALPAPRLDNQFADLSKPNSSHDIRVIATDFDRDGKLDLVIFSYRFYASDMPALHRSEIQFLSNQGHGVFKDVTDTIRLGYDSTTVMGYYPQVGDFNNDGLVDIFVSAPSAIDNVKGTTLLRQNQQGKFVASATTKLAQLVGQREQALIVNGPDNKKFLLVEKSWQQDGWSRVELYDFDTELR